LLNKNEDEHVRYESLCINHTSNVHESLQDKIRQLHEIGRLSSTRLVIISFLRVVGYDRQVLLSSLILFSVPVTIYAV